MSRWKAASIHFSVSVIIGLLSALLIFGVWYPHPYSQAAGADRLILLLLGVDITLGPLLTLIVFKAGKKTLRFDMAVIILLQISAYVYGMSVVVQSRPAYIVAVASNFSLITAMDLDEKDLSEAKDERFRSVPWTGPRVVGVTIPTDIAEIRSLGGKGVEYYPQRYVDYADVAERILKRAKPLDDHDLKTRHPEAVTVFDDWLRDHKRQANEVVWILFTAREDGPAFTALLDAKTGDILDVLPLNPW